MEQERRRNSAHRAREDAVSSHVVYVRSNATTNVGSFISWYSSLKHLSIVKQVKRLLGRLHQMERLNNILDQYIKVCSTICLTTVLCFPILIKIAPQMYAPKLYAAQQRFDKGNGERPRFRAAQFIFWYIHAFRYKTPDNFIRVFLKFQNEMILMFSALAISQSCTTLVIHMQTNQYGQFWQRQLIHNIPQTSMVNLLPLYDVVMCIFFVEMFLKRFYNYYVPLKQKSAQLTQQHFALVEFNRRRQHNWFWDTRAKDVTVIQRFVKGQKQFLKRQKWMREHSDVQSLTRQQQRKLCKYLNANQRYFAEMPRATWLVQYHDGEQLRYDLQNHMDEDTVKISQAPMLDDIVESNINKNPRQIWVSRVLFIAIIILLVIFYFFPQQIMLGSLQTQIDIWSRDIEQTCDGSGLCKFCFSAIFVLVPMAINGALIGAIPFVVYYSSHLYGCKSKTQERRISFIVLTIFYCIFWGFLSLFLPTTLYNNFFESMKQLTGQSFTQFLTMVGKNLEVQTLTFLEFIIMKYVLFPCFSLIRIPHILQYVFQKLVLRKRVPSFSSYDYHMKIGYLCHLAIVGLMFSTISPINSVIVCISMIFISACDRYNIENVAESIDVLNYEPDCFVSVFSAIRSGVIFMLLVLVCYYFYCPIGLSFACRCVCLVVLVIYIWYSLWQQSRLKKLLSRSSSTVSERSSAMK